MIIDFHTHIYPQAVAAKILPAAKKKLKVAVPGTGGPEDLCRMMQSGAVSRSVLLPLAKGCHDVPGLNDWVHAAATENHELIAFGAVHPLMENLDEELDRLAARGVRGVKMMPLLQQVYPDDARCFRLYQSLVDREMILVSHAGRDPLDRPEVFGTPERFAAVAESFPDLKLVLAHLGGLRMWDEVQRYLLPAGGNLFFDTAYVSFYMEPKEIRDLIMDIGPERIMFGSDYPWEEPGLAAEIIRDLGLSEAEEDAIFFQNAAGLLGLLH